MWKAPLWLVVVLPFLFIWPYLFDNEVKGADK